MRVLIVDDSRLMRTMNERALVKAGHVVFVAEDGEKGMAAAKECTPDVIVLDMMLPKIAGIELLHRLRKDDRTSSVPIIVLTSLSDANASSVIHEGATAFFEKSILSTEQGTAEFVGAIEQLAGPGTHKGD
jgi:DNA-binding response OmpR family regulator